MSYHSAKHCCSPKNCCSINLYLSLNTPAISNHCFPQVLLWDTTSGNSPIASIEKAHGSCDVHTVDWNRHREHLIVTGEEADTSEDGILPVIFGYLELQLAFRCYNKSIVTTANCSWKSYFV